MTILPRLSWSAAGVVGISALNQGIALATMMVLTRLMTPNEFGLLSIILAILTLAAIPFRGGFPLYATHHIASGDPSSVQGLIKRWRWLIPLMAFIVGLILSVFFFATHAFVQAAPMMTAPLYLAAIASVMLCGAIQRGYFHLVRGRIIELLIQPVLLIVPLLILLFLQTSLSAGMVMALQMSTMLLAAVMAWRLTGMIIPTSDQPPLYHDRQWLRETLPMMLGMALITINATIDVIMVGYLLGEEEAGPYRLAAQLATFLTFFLAVSNNATQASVSRLYHQGAMSELQHLLKRSARWTSALSFPPALLLLCAPAFFLSIFFGDAYISAASALVVLVATALFNIGSGQAAQLMLLIGRGKEVSAVVAVSLALNIACNVFMIPAFGLLGAALSSALSIVVWKGYLSLRVYRLTGLSTSILPLFFQRRQNDSGSAKETSERSTPAQQ